MSAVTLQAFEEPRLLALVELLYIAAMADGELGREELAFFRRRVQSMTDERLGPDDVERIMVRVDQTIMSAGRAAVLASLGERLGAPALRQTALRMAVDMMMADKILRSSERDLIFEIADALEIDRAIAADHIARVGG